MNEDTHPSAARGAVKKMKGARKLLIIATLVALSTAFASEAWAFRRPRSYSNASLPVGIDYAGTALKDGVYAGAATGYEPGLRVEVKVQGGRISAISIVENNETPRWFRDVVDLIPRRIISSQSTAVDTVSGATSSSHGILSAVEDALKSARL